MDIQTKNIDQVINEEIDMIEAAVMSNKEWLVEFQLAHVFYPGIYIRQMVAREGDFITSAIHKTTHPFFLMKGKLNVFGSKSGMQLLEAPYMGMTIGGTRRIAHVIEDCLWVTVHQIDYVTGEENEWDDEKKNSLIERIEMDLIEPHINLITNSDVRKEYQSILNERRLK